MHTLPVHPYILPPIRPVLVPLCTKMRAPPPPYILSAHLARAGIEHGP